MPNSESNCNWLALEAEPRVWKTRRRSSILAIFSKASLSRAVARNVSDRKLTTYEEAGTNSMWGCHFNGIILWDKWKKVWLGWLGLIILVHRMSSSLLSVFCSSIHRLLCSWRSYVAIFLKNFKLRKSVKVGHHSNRKVIVQPNITFLLCLVDSINNYPAKYPI